MSEKDIFIDINQKLEDEGYNIKIQNITELSNFLSNDENQENPLYEDILELYDQIRLGIGMW